MNPKEEFVLLYRRNIKREGSKELLDYLLSEKESDFFVAPASSRYHYAMEGGLVKHSINVYNCLSRYMARPEVKEIYKLSFEDESIAIVSLLHDLCKINVYVTSFRNVKDSNGNWQKVPYYEFKDSLPYGHGEKSVYIINKYMKLTDDEAFAIRFHMGFSGNDDERNVGSVFEKYPLALALSIADMEATFFIE